MLICTFLLLMSAHNYQKNGGIKLSKLYKSYINLKKSNPEKIYIFKSGMFYIGLQEDAKKLSEIFGFKITNLNEEVVKAGFPQNRLEHYVSKLNEINDINFEIIDSDYGKIENYNDYLNNNKMKFIIDDILKLDLDDTTFRQAFDILSNLKLKVEEVYKQ